MSSGLSGLTGCGLLVIDLQRAFCLKDGSVARQGRDISACKEVVDKCKPLVVAARMGNVPVIWTRMVFRPDYADGGVLVHSLRPGMKQVGALRAGTEDAEFVPDLDVRDEDFVIEKARFSAFIGTCLELTLRQLAVQRLFVCGVTTSMCVESTVRDASQRDFNVYVIQDACAELDRMRHEASITAMAFGFAKIVDTEKATAMLSGRETVD